MPDQKETNKSSQNTANNDSGESFSFKREGNVVNIFINFGTATNNAGGSGDPSSKPKGTGETENVSTEDKTKRKQTLKGNKAGGANA